MKFIRPESNSTYNSNDTKGLKLLTRPRLGLSHLGDHRFRHNFQDCVSPNVLLGSGYWNNNSLPPSLPESSLCRENPLSRDKLSKSNRLKTNWFNNYKDFAIRWQCTRFWNKQNFTDVYNRVYFINREIQLSLIRVKLKGAVTDMRDFARSKFFRI